MSLLPEYQGCRRLMAAILLRAYDDVRGVGPLDYPGQSREEMQRDAVGYLATDKAAEVLLGELDILGSPQYLLEKALENRKR